MLTLITWMMYAGIAGLILWSVALTALFVWILRELKR